MNPLFTLREEFRFHDSGRFRKKAGDAKFRFYHSFVPVLMSLAAESCRSRAESVHLLKPFTMGKGLKEFQLCDSRRLRKKPQDAQDDVTELFDLFDAHFWVGKVTEFGLPKAVLPSSARGCLCHPSCLLWFHGFWQTFEAAGCVQSVMSQLQKQDCHTLQRVDLARPFWVSPAIKIEMKTASKWPCLKRKAVARGNPIFGSVEPCDLLETRSSLNTLRK